jgi:hypothetical protein
VAGHAGEVRVNVGGEPDRDDFGLPPVDIEIPDDARELDRDVQAYRRELRALRRQMRIGRLQGPLTRDGLVLPLLAGCLAIVLISGVLLTVFSAGQGRAPRLPSASSGRPTHASIGPAPGRSPAPTGLPAGKVVIAGRPVELTSLTSSVLALVPAGCQCVAELRQLRRRVGAAAGVRLYLVGETADMRQVRHLADGARIPRARVADDTGLVLTRAYNPSGLTASRHGLTAVLVAADGTPTVRVIGPGSPLAAGQLSSLAPASP